MISIGLETNMGTYNSVTVYFGFILGFSYFRYFGVGKI